MERFFIQWSRNLNTNDSVDFILPISFKSKIFIVNVGAGWSSSPAAESASADFISINGSMENGPNFYLDKVYIITYLNNSGANGVYAHLIILGI